MKIFIDFDDVLFDAKKFRKDLKKIFLKNGVKRDQFEDTYYTFEKKGWETGRYYYPKDQIRRLKKDFKVNTQKLEKEIFRLLLDLRKYLFFDAGWFLRKFSKKDLFLITYGHKKFQKDKIVGSMIGKYFKKIIISKENKLLEIVRVMRVWGLKKEGVIFIDDKPEHLKKIEKKAKSIKTIHMRRPQGRYSKDKCRHSDCEAKNLKQAYKIINSMQK